MAGFTRRTHIVRCYKDKAQKGDTYVDVEVLDAIAFRYDANKEMILSVNTDDCVPFRVDDTGGGNSDAPGAGATRRTHMERVKGANGAMLDIEVLDAIGFTDQNGGEWILDNTLKGGRFNTTDNTSEGGALTRRVHNEKIAQDMKKPSKTDFITSERCDMMSFIGPNGQEVTISCPSNDDLNSSDKRASTYLVSPKNYSAADDKQKVPPNKDPHVYVSFPKNAKSIWTGRAKVNMGPLWWLRKAHTGGGGLIYFRIAQRYESDKPKLDPLALVEGLPWASFNAFDLVGGKKDPQGSPLEDVDIEDPVTDQMLSKYLYWAQHEKRTVSRVTSTTPDHPFYIVDTANWTLVYDHHITSRITEIMSEDAALAQFRGLIGSPGYEGLDPDKMGVALINPTFQEISVNPPDAYFWGGVAAGWAYHTEILPGNEVTTYDDVISIIFNLEKLQRDLASGGSLPKTVEFTITPPTTIGEPKGRLTWWVQAQPFLAKISDPPDPGAGERRSFPVEDKVTPVRGIPGAYNTLFDNPSKPAGWLDFPFGGANVEEEEGWTTGTQAHVKITFGENGEKPEIEISFENDDDGGGIG